MLPAAAGVDHYPCLRSAQEEAISVGTTVRCELSWDEDHARGDLRPREQKRCQCQELHSTLPRVKIRSILAGVPFG